MKAKLKLKYFLVFLVLLAVAVWLAVFFLPDNRLHLIFCDVGQGDATLITKGFSQILIDGGPDERVIQCLSNHLPFFDHKLELTVLTHPEADHLTGLISVLDKYEVDTFITGPEGNESAVFDKLVQSLKLKIKNEGVLVTNIYAGDKVRLGEIELQTLWPEREWIANQLTNYQIANYGGYILGASTDTPLNDFSLVFLLQYKDLDVLLMGDADSQVQDEIARNNTLIPIDILKFPHHGSKTGMTSEFLQKIAPKEVVISVGKNSFGHPTAETLKLLEENYVKIRRTDKEGEIKYEFP